jgi:hypothetical protein
MEVSDQLHAPGALPLEKDLRGTHNNFSFWSIMVPKLQKLCHLNLHESESKLHHPTFTGI